MSITIDLPDALMKKLRDQAKASGKDVETLVREAVEIKMAAVGRSFLDIMAPVHEEHDTSGVSEEELEQFLENELKQARADRKANRKS